MSRISRFLATALLAVACTSNVPVTSSPTAPPAAPRSQTASAQPLATLATLSPTPAAPETSTPTATSTAKATTALSWATDLALIDRSVRSFHPTPFVNHPESEWTAKLAELAETLPNADPDQQFAQVMSLIGLLDTHTWMDPAEPAHVYPLWLYRFPEGWYVVRASNSDLVGDRLVSINGMSASAVEATLRRLVPFDSESGARIGVENLMSWVEVLHGSGIVSDINHPRYLLAEPDGNRITPELSVVDRGTFQDANGIVGYLLGSAPEAVRRRTELIWTHVDKPDHVVLVSVSDYGDMTAAIDEMTAALDSGDADRVIVDMRYLRGGSGDIRLLDALAHDPRINRPGA